MKLSDCRHFPNHMAKPRTGHCEGGDQDNPDHLRVCLTCGHVGCCNSDIGRHARKHAFETGHQVMANFPADENSPVWCYKDNGYLEP